MFTFLTLTIGITDIVFIAFLVYGFFWTRRQRKKN